MKLYDIVKSLQEAQGNIAKQCILMQHKDNELFKEYMRAVYDPGINYYQKKIPKPNHIGVCDFGELDIKEMLLSYAERKYTGNAAISLLKGHLETLNEHGQKLMSLLLDRSIGASVGDTMVLKTWPDLYFSVPYQRCSLLDTKAKEKFSKLPLMYVQEKCDGSFLYLVKEAGKAAEAITRAGSKYPKEFAEKLAEGVPDSCVLIGELLVFTNPRYDGKMDILDRQTGNGMLNSILKGGDVESNFIYKVIAWDVLDPEEFYAGKSKRGYAQRLSALNIISRSNKVPNVEMVSTDQVHSLDEAYTIYSKYTAEGLEGAVLKTADFLWKDGTSKDCVKMKVEFEIDLEITGVAEGSGKATGMMGALQLKSSCGGLVTDVGTGFSDDLRNYFWINRDVMVGQIVSIKANDIISKRDRDTKSLFLPVFIEERHDKTIADSLEDCESILASAKGLK